jgi:fibronectin type 3 domain-containing protein
MSLNANINSYTDTTVAMATSYIYRVKAVKTGAPPSGYSNELMVSTPNGTGPNAPTNLRTLSISPTQVKLTWDDNSEDEANFILEYVYRVKAVNTVGSSAYAMVNVTT